MINDPPEETKDASFSVDSSTPVVLENGTTKPVENLVVGDIVQTSPPVAEEEEEDDILVVGETEPQQLSDITQQAESDITENAADDDDQKFESAVEAARAELDEDDNAADGVLFPEDRVDLRGEDETALVELYRARANEIGGADLDNRVRTIGSFENLVFRAIMDPNLEERRIQEALADLKPEEREALSFRYPATGKAQLRTSRIGFANPAAGETKEFTGAMAMQAFEFQETGGGFRVMLYNSGIALDMIVPTGNDIQTLLSNCIAHDNQLGSSSGLHYFTYADLMFKNQIINFLQPLIVGSSYADWRKKGKLWSVIKIQDLASIVAHLAAFCYPDGFEGFMTKCTRPKTEEFPLTCGHVETHKLNILKLILTRFPAMSTSAIQHMVEARLPNAQHGIGAIAKYQSDLGFEGERITFEDITFVMRIPSITEHLAAGAVFMSDLINEVEADNTEGRYEQLGFRYMRTFLPFIGAVEKAIPSGGINRTSDTDVIVRQLEKLDHEDTEGKLRDALRKYINKTQLTYVGYPATPCPTCNYTPDTPSGLMTFDPFSAFFTLALQYLRASV